MRGSSSFQPCQLCYRQLSLLPLYLLTDVHALLQVEKAFQELGALTETIKQEALDFVATERKTLQEAKSLADNTTNTEILRLRQQNSLLTRLLETERVEAKRSADALLERIAGLLGDYTNERDRSLRGTFSEMTESNTVAEREMEELGQKQGQQLEAAVVRGSAWSEQLAKRGVNGKRLRDGGMKVSVPATIF